MNYLELKDYPPMMNVTQTAEFLGTGKHAVYKMAKQQGFPSIMVGGKVKVIRDKLMSWFDNNIDNRHS